LHMSINFFTMLMIFIQAYLGLEVLMEIFRVR
jgi:hypothetical protein